MAKVSKQICTKEKGMNSRIKYLYLDKNLCHIPQGHTHCSVNSNNSTSLPSWDYMTPLSEYRSNFQMHDGQKYRNSSNIFHYNCLLRSIISKQEQDYKLLIIAMISTKGSIRWMYVTCFGVITTIWDRAHAIRWRNWSSLSKAIIFQTSFFNGLKSKLLSIGTKNENKKMNQVEWVMNLICQSYYKDISSTYDKE